MSCVLRVFYFARSFSCRRKFHSTPSLFLEFSSFLICCAVVICCMRCKLAQINSNSHAKLSVSSPMRLSNGPDTRCNIARNIARNIRHSTWLHGRNVSCNITRNMWLAVTKIVSFSNAAALTLLVLKWGESLFNRHRFSLKLSIINIRSLLKIEWMSGFMKVKMKPDI